MICRNCGAELPPDTALCPVCGALNRAALAELRSRLEPDEPEDEQPEGGEEYGGEEYGEEEELSEPEVKKPVFFSRWFWIAALAAFIALIAIAVTGIDNSGGNPLLAAEISSAEITDDESGRKIGEYAYISADKSEIQGISSAELADFVSKRVERKSFDYWTADFGDGTGLVFEKGEPLIVYCVLGDDKSVSRELGYIVSGSGGVYSYDGISDSEQIKKEVAADIDSRIMAIVRDAETEYSAFTELIPALREGDTELYDKVETYYDDLRDYVYNQLENLGGNGTEEFDTYVEYATAYMHCMTIAAKKAMDYIDKGEEESLTELQSEQKYGSSFGAALRSRRYSFLQSAGFTPEEIKAIYSA